MIHRAPFGSMERFMSILIEHTAGNLPLWLMPEQYAILPISDKFNSYSEELLNRLSLRDIRGYIDSRNESTSKKIHDTWAKKIPFMLIIGERKSRLMRYP